MTEEEEGLPAFIVKGREKAKLFPWATIADEWLEVIHKDLEMKGIKPVRK